MVKGKRFHICKDARAGVFTQTKQQEVSKFLVYRRKISRLGAYKRLLSPVVAATFLRHICL